MPRFPTIPTRRTTVSETSEAFARIEAHAREIYNLRLLTWLQGRAVSGGGVADLELEARFAFKNAHSFEKVRTAECRRSEALARGEVVSNDSLPIRDGDAERAHGPSRSLEWSPRQWVVGPTRDALIAALHAAMGADVDAATFEEARRAWLAAGESYGWTAAGRADS